MFKNMIMNIAHKLHSARKSRHNQKENSYNKQINIKKIKNILPEKHVTYTTSKKSRIDHGSKIEA